MVMQRLLLKIFPTDNKVVEIVFVLATGNLKFSLDEPAAGMNPQETAPLTES